MLKTLSENLENVNQFNLDWTLALSCVNVYCISYISCFFDITVKLSEPGNYLITKISTHVRIGVAICNVLLHE